MSKQNYRLKVTLEFDLDVEVPSLSSREFEQRRAKFEASLMIKEIFKGNFPDAKCLDITINHEEARLIG